MGDIALVCALGGHLAEMKLLEDSYAYHDHFFITCEGSSSLGINLGRAYCLSNPVSSNRDITSLKAYLIWLLIAWVRVAQILNKEKPKIIISTGPSGLMFPAFYFGKIIGAKTVFIESIGRFNPSLAGRLAYPITDKLFVRNPEVLKKYGQKAEFHRGKNKVIVRNKTKQDKKSIIFVTTGSSYLPFPRLIRTMDNIAPKLPLPVVMQIGECKYKPKNARFFDFCEPDEIKKYYEGANIVVGHASPGTLLDMARFGARAVLFPRRKEYGEVINNNQLVHAKVFRQLGFAIAENEHELEGILLHRQDGLLRVKLDLEKWNQRLVGEIKAYIDSVLIN